MTTEPPGALSPPSGEASAFVYPEGIDGYREGPYRIRFAREALDLEALQRLRFAVFNEELGEGFASSWETGKDSDPYDAVCHHLMLEDSRSGELVGTYRMQTPGMAARGIGLYCAQEFQLDALPTDILERSVELGRACILREHRNGLALFALWRGLATYLSWSGAHLLFGCCSLTSVDERDGARMLRYLEDAGHMSTTLTVQPVPACVCDLSLSPAEGREEVVVPRLFATYLRYGAHVLGPPAIDRDFGTIDFLILLDVKSFGRRLRDMFFSGLPAVRRGPSADTDL